MEEHLVDLLGLAKLLLSCAIFGNLEKKWHFKLPRREVTITPPKSIFGLFWRKKNLNDFEPVLQTGLLDSKIPNSNHFTRIIKFIIAPKIDLGRLSPRKWLADEFRCSHQEGIENQRCHNCSRASLISVSIFDWDILWRQCCHILKYFKLYLCFSLLSAINEFCQRFIKSS